MTEPATGFYRTDIGLLWYVDHVVGKKVFAHRREPMGWRLKVLTRSKWDTYARDNGLQPTDATIVSHSSKAAYEILARVQSKQQERANVRRPASEPKPARLRAVSDLYDFAGRYLRVRVVRARANRSASRRQATARVPR